MPGTAVGGLGLKIVAAGGLAAVVSILAVLVGFTIVPLTPGRELLDAARRLAAGLFCSFTLGPMVAFKVIDWWPSYLDRYLRLLDGESFFLAYTFAAAPFLAFTGILGFWLVAAGMRFFTSRADKDLMQMANEVRRQLIAGDYQQAADKVVHLANTRPGGLG